jgi:hypothetical protein
MIIIHEKNTTHKRVVSLYVTDISLDLFFENYFANELTTRLKTHRLFKLISTGVNNVVWPTMNKLSTMLFQVVIVEQCCNNMLTILFIYSGPHNLVHAC